MKKILYFFLGLVVVFSALFLMLKNGISIASIQFDFLKLEQLYIKLDNKLILRAKHIIISENQDNADANDELLASKELVKIAQNLNLLYAFVEEIHIENLYFKEQQIRIFFKNNEFILDENLFFLKLTLHPSNHYLKAKIKELFLKDYGLNIAGELSLDASNDFYHFSGSGYSDELDFNATLSYKNYQFAYSFDNINIHNMLAIATKLKKRVELSEELNLWLFDKIKASFYHLDTVQGFIDFATDDYFWDRLKIKGFAEDVSLRLDGKMPPIKFPKLHIDLNKQKLDFNFDKASYKNADLSGSRVYLYDIFDEEKAGIYLRIRSNNMIFDENLAQALRQYDFFLPFHQKSGKMKGDFELQTSFFTDAKVRYKGVFVLDDVDLSLADFSVKKAQVRLRDENVSIENASVKNGFLEADFNAQIDLNAKKGIFQTQISRLYFDPFFNMTDQKISLDLDYTDGVKINIPDWNMHLDFTQGLELEAEDLKMLLPYFTFAEKIALQSVQSLQYKSPDFQDFIMHINHASFGEKFLINGTAPYTQDSFTIAQQKGITTLNSKSDLISGIFDEHHKEMHFKNLTYIHKNDGKENFSLESNRENIQIGGANVGIILADLNKTLQFERLEAFLHGSHLKAEAKRKNAKFSLLYTPNDLNLTARDMDDEFLDLFLQKQVFKDGLFDLSIVGSGVDFFEGKFAFKDTHIRDLKGINQLIAFIDTVPSLILFKVPKFNNEGLHIQDGKVIFNRKKDLLSFNAINLNGDNVSLFGLGSANLRLNTIDLDLELKTLKSAASTISKIPIVNYIILGKDQEISTNIKVDGSLDDPNFKTQILTDTLKTPFNLIKNIIQIPSNFVD